MYLLLGSSYEVPAFINLVEEMTWVISWGNINFVSRPPPTVHSIPAKEECFLLFYASYDSIVLLHLDHVGHVSEEDL